MFEIILASKSKVRKQILDKNNIICRVKPSNVDEEAVKNNLIKERATPEIISKNLAELKANKISQKIVNTLVLGATVSRPQPIWTEPSRPMRDPARQAAFLFRISFD